jgi:CRP-like cAMP-binding protein
MMGILDDFDMEWLITNGSVIQVAKDTVLIREGGEVDSLYILLDGRLSIMRSGIDREIARLTAGEILGEISFVDSRAPTASVIALQDSQVLSIPREVLKEKLAADVAFAARFYHAIGAFLADRLRATVSQLGYGRVTETAAAAGDLDDRWMEDVSFAATRFDQLLRRLGIVQPAA